jgi:hypothetical protein
MDAERYQELLESLNKEIDRHKSESSQLWNRIYMSKWRFRERVAIEKRDRLIEICRVLEDCRTLLRSMPLKTPTPV